MRRLATALVLVLVAAGLLACGEDDGSTTGPTPGAETTGAAETTTAKSPAKAPELPLLDDGVGDPQVRYAADPSGAWAYYVTEASASPGKVTIEFVNPQKTVHNVAVEAPNGETIAETKKIGRGRTSTQAVLKPIQYLVYCSVPGHRKAGMKGHLTVYP